MKAIRTHDYGLLQELVSVRANSSRAETSPHSLGKISNRINALIGRLR
jgi:hypothetical protein